MRKIIPLILTLICLSFPAAAQQVIHNEEPVDPTQVLMFLPDRDVPPPYEVTGEVIDGVATIYINGIQIIPNPWRERGRRLPRGNFDQYRRPFVDVQCDMQELGCTLDEITEAYIEYMRDCPGVVDIERNNHDLSIQFEDGSTVESWMRFISCDMQKIVNSKVKSYQGWLDKGYAYLFTPVRQLQCISPRGYDKMVADIKAARNGSVSIEESQWNFLKSDMIESIRKVRGE